MKKIVITGGSGFLGQAIAARLVANGSDVVIVSRGQHRIAGCRVVGWEMLQQVVEGADAVINLAGSSVGGPRWSARVRHEIRKSRIESTQHVVDAIAKCSHPPSLISASAVGYYGNTMIPSNEAMGAGASFLANVTAAWEKEALKAQVHTRVACLRIGVVLDPHQGALPKLVGPMKAFVGGVLGSGRQGMPWVHVNDVVSAFVWAVDSKDAYGAINVVAPEAVTMAEFIGTLGSVLKRPTWLHVPTIALRLLLGRQADVVLHGQHVVPYRLLGSNFTFAHPTLRNALEDLLSVR
ncbi:MAG: TIGR01777 family protein [Ignavibacteria bacterium]|nr:TIGR01777 family protein [Ignavibacteria bacterium]